MVIRIVALLTAVMSVLKVMLIRRAAINRYGERLACSGAIAKPLARRGDLHVGPLVGISIATSGTSPQPIALP